MIMNTNKGVSLSGELNEIEKTKNSRDNLITIAGLTATVITGLLTSYTGLDIAIISYITPIIMFIYNYILTYLCRKYNWLRVDNDGTLIISNKNYE